MTTTNTLYPLLTMQIGCIQDLKQIRYTVSESQNSEFTHEAHTKSVGGASSGRISMGFNREINFGRP